jgi:hypothetical protein
VSDKPGDGDLDVDAAWAEIVAHWDVEDLRVVTDDDTADAGGDGDDDAVPPAAVAEPGTAGPAAEDPMTWTEIGLDDWSQGSGTPPPGGPAAAATPVRPVPGPPAPSGRPSRRDDPDHGPGLGWDAIRAAARGENPLAGRDPVRDTARDRARGAGHDDDRDDPALAALDEHFVPADPPSLRPTDPLSGLAWLGALGGPLFLLVAALVWREAPSVLIGAAVLAFVAGFVTLVVRMPDERQDEDDGAVV